MKDLVYLDFAAATPVSTEVYMAMEPYFQEQFYNPSALYTAARDVKRALEEARSSVAREIGAKPGEIIFTAGGTESDNLAIHGIMQRHPDKKLLISAIEHDAVRETAKNYTHGIVPVTPKGEVLLSKLKEQIDDDVVLISIVMASNEVGTVQPIKDVTALVADVRNDRKNRGVDVPVYVHTDACQAAGHLDIHVARTGVDLMTLNGGKIYGPKQSGILFVRAGVLLAPLVFGGGQESGMRSGTENVPNAIGFSVALSAARKKFLSEKRRLSELRSWFVAELTKRLPECSVHGHPKRCAPQTVSFAVPGVDNERLMMMLDENGYMVATGSACSASKQEASAVLTAMGIDENTARSTLRLSFGRTTTKQQLEGFLNCLSEQVAAIKDLL